MSDATRREPQDVHGGDMLARISDEVVRAQKEFFGKGPEKTKSYMLDDLLIVVMRGGMTRAEETMLEFDQQDMVRQFRQLFENKMTPRLSTMIEELTGRKVANFQSQVMFDPDLMVEMFVFEQPARQDAVEATAEGQLRDDETGAATDSEALEQPSESPQ